MEQILLANTGRGTTRLGFGCSSLMGGMGRRESLAVLESAFDAGIRHFDVAPMYGYGAAENCLGEFLRCHSGEATVTTKYGILPAKNQSLIGVARSLARPLVRNIPGMKQRLARVAGAVARNPEKASFTAEQARASLERSRAELQLERIDVWLLHDAAAESLTDPGLLAFLQQSVEDGMIGCFGVSNDIAQIPALYEQRRAYCQVLQFEWSVRNPVPEFPGSFRIHHRALMDNFRFLRTVLEQQTELRRQWSEELSYDLEPAENLAALMLKSALVMNPGSIVLFSSKNPRNIEANVRVSEDGTLEDKALRFHSMVHRDAEKVFSHRQAD